MGLWISCTLGEKWQHSIYTWSAVIDPENSVTVNKREEERFAPTQVKLFHMRCFNSLKRLICSPVQPFPRYAKVVWKTHFLIGVSPGCCTSHFDAAAGQQKKENYITCILCRSRLEGLVRHPIQSELGKSAMRDANPLHVILCGSRIDFQTNQPRNKQLKLSEQTKPNIPEEHEQGDFKFIQLFKEKRNMSHNALRPAPAPEKCKT